MVQALQSKLTIKEVGKEDKDVATGRVAFRGDLIGQGVMKDNHNTITENP